MNTYEKILIEEKEIKPNKYVGKAMLFSFLVLTLFEVLNEFNVFHVAKMNMRLALAFGFIFVCISQVIAKKFPEKRSSKYILLFSLEGLVLVIGTLLSQWSELLFFLPPLLGSMYTEKRTSKIGIIGASIISVIAPLLNVLLKLGQTDYYIFLINTLGFNVPDIITNPDYNLINSLLKVFLYKGFPNSLLIYAFSTILINQSKSGHINIESRIKAKYLSETDILTNLYNRISFEQQLIEFAKKPQMNIVCIFADADNLHEINNEKGHKVGDELLKQCGEELLKYFDSEYTYRIGGDEFIVFAFNLSIEDIDLKLRLINSELSEQGYHMSMGYSFQSICYNVNGMVNAAESEMYKQKSHFYMATGKDRRRIQ